MLTRVAPGPAVVACNTCRLSAEAQEDADGSRGGARLVAALRAVKASDPIYDGVAVQEMPCLFACAEFCTVHLRADELPAGRIIASLSRHVVAVIDGVIHDIYDPSRDGTRCVYGYWTVPEEDHDDR